MASTPTSCDSTMMLPRRSPSTASTAVSSSGGGCTMSATTPRMPDCAPGAFALAPLLHDGADALLKALVAILDLDQRPQARAAPVRLLAQGLELHLAAARGGAQLRAGAPPRCAAAPPPRRAAPAASPGWCAAPRPPPTAPRCARPTPTSSVAMAAIRPREILAPRRRRRPLGLVARDARLPLRDLGQARVQLAPRLRQRRAQRLVLLLLGLELGAARRRLARRTAPTWPSSSSMVDGVGGDARRQLVDLLPRRRRRAP